MVSSLHIKNLLHRKIPFRLIIPLITAAMMLVVIIIDSFFTSFPAITFAWVLVGIVIGFPFGRLTKISWNSDKTQLVLDGSGMALLVAYIVTSIIRSIILRMEFGYLSYVLAITLLASVGGAIGRTLGMMKQIQLAVKSNRPSSG
ncbi:MAG TPA: hypothetical protein VE223_05545 [Nitrososphaeraceae archaeon]|nr:hypothetical protein [Nitrososphaeraceae archaeon]